MGSRPPFRALLLAALLAAVGSARAAADPDTYYVDDPERWGAPRVAVAPEYPADALAKHATAIVKVQGTVAPTGELEAISYSVDPPGAMAFVDAVKEVLPHWIFYTPIGKDCMPSHEPVQEELWFEIRDGQPHVSVSRARVARGPDRTSWLKPVLRGEFRYPRQAIREDAEATVYARLEVDAAGNVTGVGTQTWLKTPWGSEHAFEEESRRALSGFTFPPAPEGRTRTRTVCYTIDFRLRN